MIRIYLTYLLFAASSILYAQSADDRQQLAKLYSPPSAKHAPQPNTSTTRPHKPAVTRTARKPTISDAYIDKAIRQAAVKADVPYLLLKGLCSAESNLNPKAYAYNDGGKGNHSIGLCQVLRATGDSLLGPDPGCKRDFRFASGLTRSYQNCKLFGPKVNALAAAYYLKSQLKRYAGDTSKAIAAYNTGSLKTCGASGQVKSRRGKYLYSCVPGDLLNRRYVERVDSFILKFSLADGASCSRRNQ